MGKSTEKQKNQKITDANFDGKTKKAENRGWEKQWENRNQQKKKGWDNDGIVIDGKKRMERFRKLGNRWNFGTLWTLSFLHRSFLFLFQNKEPLFLKV